MELVLLLCVLLLAQYGLSLIQIRYYKKSMDKIVSGYNNKQGYFMFSGMERGKFKPGAIAVLIVDQDYVVHECHLMKGISILSKFNEVSKYKGIHLGELLFDINEEISQIQNKKKMPAFAKALQQAAENAMLTISKNKVSTV